MTLEAWQVGPPLPQYNHLRRLELGYSLIIHKQLFGVIHTTPTLKFLAINVYDLDYYDYDTMECVPSCIVSHLEDIEFRSFVGQPLQYNLAKFLLKKGEKLMKLYLFGIRCRLYEKYIGVDKCQTGSEIAFIEGYVYLYI